MASGPVAGDDLLVTPIAAGPIETPVDTTAISAASGPGVASEAVVAGGSWVAAGSLADPASPGPFAGMVDASGALVLPGPTMDAPGTGPASASPFAGVVDANGGLALSGSPVDLGTGPVSANPFAGVLGANGGLDLAYNPAVHRVGIPNAGSAAFTGVFLPNWHPYGPNPIYDEYSCSPGPANANLTFALVGTSAGLTVVPTPCVAFPM